MQRVNLNRNDLLAIQRTNLANERTLLSWFRTFVVLLSSGFAIVKMTVLNEIITLGYAFLIASPFILIVGIWRYFLLKRRIRKFYTEDFQDAV